MHVMGVSLSLSVIVGAHVKCETKHTGVLFNTYKQVIHCVPALQHSIIQLGCCFVDDNLCDVYIQAHISTVSDLL